MKWPRLSKGRALGDAAGWYLEELSKMNLQKTISGFHLIKDSSSRTYIEKHAHFHSENHNFKRTQLITFEDILHYYLVCLFSEIKSTYVASAFLGKTWRYC